MRETVTEHKVVEKKEEKEVIRSDLSGSKLDEDEVIPLVANPTCTSGGIYADGEIHVSIGEYAELADVSEENIDTNTRLPNIYVQKASPEVVKKQYIPDIPKGPAMSFLSFGNVFALLLLLYIVETFVASGTIPASISGLVILNLVFTIVSAFGFFFGITAYFGP